MRHGLSGRGVGFAAHPSAGVVVCSAHKKTLLWRDTPQALRAWGCAPATPCFAGAILDRFLGHETAVARRRPAGPICATGQRGVLPDARRRKEVLGRGGSGGEGHKAGVWSRKRARQRVKRRHAGPSRTARRSSPARRRRPGRDPRSQRCDRSVGCARSLYDGSMPPQTPPGRRQDTMSASRQSGRGT